MKKRIKYTDEPMEVGEVVKDFLPPPSQLVKRESTVKITLEVTRDSLAFFKKQAKLAHVPYQRMLRSLIDAYARQHI
jgi:predicted DNA binding CopG/RHH family protein